MSRGSQMIAGFIQKKIWPQNNKITGKYVLVYCLVACFEQDELRVSDAKAFIVYHLIVSLPGVKYECGHSVDSL